MSHQLFFLSIFFPCFNLAAEDHPWSPQSFWDKIFSHFSISGPFSQPHSYLAFTLPLPPQTWSLANMILPCLGELRIEAVSGGTGKPTHKVRKPMCGQQCLSFSTWTCPCLWLPEPGSLIPSPLTSHALIILSSIALLSAITFMACWSSHPHSFFHFYLFAVLFICFPLPCFPFSTTCSSLDYFFLSVLFLDVSYWTCVCVCFLLPFFFFQGAQKESRSSLLQDKKNLFSFNMIYRPFASVSSFNFNSCHSCPPTWWCSHRELSFFLKYALPFTGTITSAGKTWPPWTHCSATSYSCFNPQMFLPLAGISWLGISLLRASILYFSEHMYCISLFVYMSPPLDSAP